METASGRKLKALPRSRAKTAYGLLAAVIRAMEEEPKRVDIGMYVRHVIPELGGPDCGTVGCIAGWTAILGLPHTRITNSAAWMEANNLITGILMYSEPYYDSKNREVVNDFYSTCHPDYLSAVDSPVNSTSPRTPEHANAVIARIRKFMKKHEKFLRARKLPRG